MVTKLEVQATITEAIGGLLLVIYVLLARRERR
jgi:hypothetical protein